MYRAHAAMQHARRLLNLLLSLRSTIFFPLSSLYPIYAVVMLLMLLLPVMMLCVEQGNGRIAAQYTTG